MYRNQDREKPGIPRLWLLAKSAEYHEESEMTYRSPSPAIAKQPVKDFEGFERAIRLLSSKKVVAHKFCSGGHIKPLENDAQL